MSSADYVNRLRPAPQSRELILLEALGQVRTEMVGKAECLIVPVVALMEGVIHAVNAETPEFVSEAMLRDAAATWEGKPVVLFHPKDDAGRPVTAQSATVWDKAGLGTLRNCRVEGKKFLMEAVIEKSRAKDLHPNMYVALEGGQTIEVSVGAVVLTDHAAGSHGGKSFVGSWTKAVGDHLAFLPGGRGACSCAMGCGTHRAAQMRVCEDRLEEVVSSIIDPETLRFLRDVPQSERDAMSKSDFGDPKNELYPIKTQADVDAAAHLIGKAGPGVKERIIAIAKRKGLAIPDAWKPTMKAAQAGDDAEEAAELIAYKSIRAMLDTIQSHWKQASDLCDALIAAEVDDAAETPEDEAAEEQVETASLDAIKSAAGAMSGALSGILNACYGQSLGAYEARAAAGARNSKSDASVIQRMHDDAASLGAACAAGNVGLRDARREASDKQDDHPDDPTRSYIRRVTGRSH